jgi:hypothetical protein
MKYERKGKGGKINKNGKFTRERYANRRENIG